MSDNRLFEQVGFRRGTDATELLLLRHGQSEAADPVRPFELVEGRGDPALSELGRQQAAAVCDRLLRKPPAAVYVTPLRRTSQTVESLIERLGLVPVVESGLIEVGLGEWEGGLYRQRVAERHPVAIEMERVGRWDVIPGAESNEQLQARVVAAVERIAARHRGQSVLVAAHGGSIACALAYAVGAPIFSFLTTDNAALSSIVIVDRTWTLRRFNDSAHLES